MTVTLWSRLMLRCTMIRRPFRRHHRKTAIRAALILFPITIVALVAGPWWATTVFFSVVLVVIFKISFDAYYYQLRCGTSLRRDLGFELSSKYGDAAMEKTIVFARVDPAGVLARAGIAEGDALLDDFSLTEFYKTLEHARGQEPVSFTVASWNADGGSLSTEMRQISISVPTK